MNIFARLCRVTGRFILTIGAILLIASICLQFMPNQAGIHEVVESVNQLPQDTSITITHTGSSVSPLAFIIALVFTALVFALFVPALGSYNNFIRTCIKKLAHLLKLKIFVTELALTIFVWTIVTVLGLSLSPLLAMFILCIAIINLLCFIFAWVAYGQPDYLC